VEVGSTPLAVRIGGSRVQPDRFGVMGDGLVVLASATQAAACSIHSSAERRPRPNSLGKNPMSAPFGFGSKLCLSLAKVTHAAEQPERRSCVGLQTAKDPQRKLRRPTADYTLRGRKESDPEVVTVHGSGGDWSVFRRLTRLYTIDVGRKHGPVPLLFRPAADRSTGDTQRCSVPSTSA